MESQKNSDLKYCHKCSVILTDENWLKYLQLPTRRHHICTTCYREYCKKLHQKDPKYNDKQLARTRFRKSAVIFAYGNECAECLENNYNKLTIDHINNDGTKHRKEVGNIYEYLYNNTPDKNKYQVLCYNCSCSKNVIYKDKYALRDKTKVIENYGYICVECKEDRIERLIIDHSNNNGVQQRRQLKYHTGVRMYRWIIKNNYPKNLGLQILCFNCNRNKLLIKNIC